MLWFRPEVVQNVKWGGNPQKPVQEEADSLKLHSRRSFEIWKEIVRNHSLPWDRSEVEAVKELRSMDIGDRRIQWIVGALPPVNADPVLIRLVFENLLDNAVKYTRTRENARIEIGSTRQDGETIYFVRDNGVGFDMKYIDKLFGVFQRLHRIEEFEGTGIGLANIRRIVERHGGRTWAILNEPPPRRNGA